MPIGTCPLHVFKNKEQPPRLPPFCSSFCLAALCTVSEPVIFKIFIIVSSEAVMGSFHPERGSFSGFLHAWLVLLGVLSAVDRWEAQSSTC